MRKTTTEMATPSDERYHISHVVITMNDCSGMRASGFSERHSRYWRNQSSPAPHEPTISSAAPM